MSDNIINKLFNIAKDAARSNDCSKHSGYTVGAALLTSDNKVYKGINIENDGIQSICAERIAFVKALSEGEKSFKAIFVVGKELNADKFVKTLPCGYCRQFMSEYTDEDFVIYTCDEIEDKLYSYKLSDLLPNGFKR